jgi:hypothetical protein
MVRASRIATGAAFHDLANATYAAQGSISYGWYDEKTLRPWFEVEIGATIDSGLFNGELGDSLEEFIGRTVLDSRLARISIYDRNLERSTQ